MIVALVTLALGIGVNTTAFTVLNRLMLQALPYRDPASLVQLWSTAPRWGNIPNAPADYFDEREQNTVFTDVAAYSMASVSYAEIGKPPIQIGALYMTANFFTILGVQPQLGRLPTEDESKHMAFVTLISDSFWHSHFNGDPNVLGKPVRMNSRVSTVIGVMPPSLNDPALFDSRPAFFYLDPVTHSRTVRKVGWYHELARLKPGVSIKQAQLQMDVVARRLAHDYPETNKDRGFAVIRYPTNQLGNDGEQLTWMTFALSGLVLLIACINLANLQLVRTTRRGQEIAIRMALGCTRWRLIGMLLLESVIVSMVGGLLGIAMGVWSNSFVVHFFDMDMPVNFRVIAFTFGVALVSGAFFGAVPAWMATRVDCAASLKSGGRGSTSDRSRHWLRQSLVVVELAMAVVLLAGAGFFVGGIYRLTHRDLGWKPGQQLIGDISLDQDNYGGDKNHPKVLAFGDRILEALRALPGVEAASISSGSPTWGTRMEPFKIEGQPAPEKGHEPEAGYFNVSPGWFEVYGIRVVQGREFLASDRSRLGAGRDRQRVDGPEELAGRVAAGQAPPGDRSGRRRQMGDGGRRHAGFQGRRRVLQPEHVQHEVPAALGPGHLGQHRVHRAHRGGARAPEGARPQGGGAAPAQPGDRLHGDDRRGRGADLLVLQLPAAHPGADRGPRASPLGRGDLRRRGQPRIGKDQGDRHTHGPRSPAGRHHLAVCAQRDHPGRHRRRGRARGLVLPRHPSGAPPARAAGQGPGRHCLRGVPPGAPGPFRLLAAGAKDDKDKSDRRPPGGVGGLPQWRA